MQTLKHHGCSGAWLVLGRLLLAGSALTEQQPQQPNRVHVVFAKLSYL